VTIAILAVLAWILVAGGPWLILPMTLAAIIGLREYFLLAEALGRPGLTIPGFLFGVAAPAMAWYWGDAGLLAALFGLLVLMGVIQLRRGVSKEVLDASMSTLYGSLLIGGGVACIMLMRNLDPAGFTCRFAGPDGIYWVLTIALSVSGADSGGHFFGANFGRRKLNPISPNKTVEGALGGISLSILAVLVGAALFRFGLPIYLLVLIGLVCGLAAVLGDLMESLIKRVAGSKDAGTSLPGLGGFLDFFDSAFIAFPVVYFLLRLLYGGR